MVSGFELRLITWFALRRVGEDILRLPGFPLFCTGGRQPVLTISLSMVSGSVFCFLLFSSLLFSFLFFSLPFPSLLPLTSFLASYNHAYHAPEQYQRPDRGGANYCVCQLISGCITPV